LTGNDDGARKVAKTIGEELIKRPRIEPAMGNAARTPNGKETGNRNS